jgi:hypothetical protein
MTARKTTRATPAAPKPVKKFIVLDDEFDKICGLKDGGYDTLDEAKKALTEFVMDDDYTSTVHIAEIVVTAVSKVTPTFHDGYKK